MSNGIAQAKNTKVLLKKDGTTKDIIKVVLDTSREVKAQTHAFSKGFAPTYQGMQKLWSWVRQNIHYNEDPLGVQWVREPARLWYDREGDCKSFTVFIVSVLENLGLRYVIRFTNTDTPNSRIVNHVYPVAILNDGTEVIVDAVYKYFDDEHPYYYKKDYSMSDIYRLAGIGNTPQQTDELTSYYNELVKIAADIPEEVTSGVDITQLSQGEFARYMSAAQFDALTESATNQKDMARYAAAASAVRGGSIAGIGALKPADASKLAQFLQQTEKQTERAFSAPVLILPENLAGIGSLKSKIVDAVKDAWKKVVNWLFKAAIPLAAPFLVYAFIKQKVGKKTDAKVEKAKGLIAWIQKTGAFDTADAVLSAVKVGLTKHFGKAPEQLIKEISKGRIGQVGAVGAIVAAAMKALPIIIEIVKKIAGLFKKNKAETPDISAADAPNEAELIAELEASQPKNITKGGDMNMHSNNYLSGLLPVIAVGAGLLYLSKQ